MEPVGYSQSTGRGPLAMALATILIGTGQGAIVDKYVRDNGRTADATIRKNLEERMKSKGTKILTAKELANGNPLQEKTYSEMENAFYSPHHKGIFLGKDFKRNAILAHEMGHSEDPALLTSINPWGKFVGSVGGLTASIIRPQKAARLAAIIGSLGLGGTLASETSASVRGYNILGDAGEKKFSEKIQAASGLPTYALAALLPGLTYKGRKWLGAFK